MDRTVTEQLIEAIEIEIESRFEPLWKLWCAWNSKMMNGDEFADEIGKMFPTATRRAWRKRLLTQKSTKVAEDNPLKKLLV